VTYTATIDGLLDGRVLPQIIQDNREFFEGAARGELLMQRCVETGKLQYYPRAASMYTMGPVEWVKMSGKGKINTFTVVRQNGPDPVFAPLCPYVIAAIDLDEGVRMFGNVTGIDPDEVYFEMPVEVYFSKVDEATGIHLPFWKPAR
jgi:uncharacterized OB-fold protein